MAYSLINPAFAQPDSSHQRRLMISFLKTRHECIFFNLIDTNWLDLSKSLHEFCLMSRKQAPEFDPAPCLIYRVYRLN